MEKTKQREWSYVMMLGISIGLFLAGWKLGVIQLEVPPAKTKAEFADGYQESAVPEWLKEFFQKPNGEADGLGVNQPLNGGQTYESIAGQNGEAAENKESAEVSGNETDRAEEEDVEVSEPFQADTSYFDDALFIGDSRTVGLLEYGDLGQAEVIADSGMSVYKLRESSFPLRSSIKMSLEELLSSRQFGKIYLMLGINELGYDFDQTVERYREIVELIQEAQPEAILFLQANLHITKEKSETSPYYNNENIDRFNDAVSKMADGKRIFYLDANPLFDDGEGALDPELTTDHSHILGKYYSTWVDWILTQAR